jgi:hypothetical protein
MNLIFIFFILVQKITDSDLLLKLNLRKFGLRMESKLGRFKSTELDKECASWTRLLA